MATDIFARERTIEEPEGRLRENEFEDGELQRDEEASGAAERSYTGMKHNMTPMLDR
jgi:hypothetical protein